MVDTIIQGDCLQVMKDIENKIHGLRLLSVARMLGRPENEEVRLIDQYNRGIDDAIQVIKKYYEK